MIEWTEPARRALNEYCTRCRVALAGSGADADEVSDDLRRHVEEEVRAANLRIVTEDDVRRILAPVGEPEAAGPPRPASFSILCPRGGTSSSSRWCRRRTSGSGVRPAPATRGTRPPSAG